MVPSKYRSFPSGSIFQKWEAEMIFRNIIVILWRTGDTWRPLSWEEYMKERKKDGNFSYAEKEYFDQVVGYTNDPDSASSIFNTNQRRTLARSSAGRVGDS